MNGMETILTSYSHLEFNKALPKGTRHKERSSNSEIKDSKPFWVETYFELVQRIAQLAFYNRNYHLFYRGQSSEYFNQKKNCIILPTIYREDPSTKSTPVKDRYEMLRNYSLALHKQVKSRKKRLAGTTILIQYEELRWAILQHYEKCPTPYIDITHSIHVASSFAIDPKDKTRDSGIIYVMGFPAISESISYYVSQKLMMIRLLSFCPPSAQRPFFQEGYVAAHFPFYNLDDANRKEQFDFTRRLIAKFEIPNSTSFFGSKFRIIPRAQLLPEGDNFKKFLDGRK